MPLRCAVGITVIGPGDLVTSFDAIVVGLGGMGSAAAHQLARRGLRVLGLEQFTPAHDRGSAHGQTRICRKAYFEHPDYVPLLHRAYALWDELSAAAGRRLFERVGLLMAGGPESELIAGVRRAATEHRLSIEDVPHGELASRFPGFAFPTNFDVLYEPGAGLLYVEDCVRAQIEQAEKRGAELRFREAVRWWWADEGQVVVETDRGRYVASRLVLTAGSWAGRLLSELDLPLRVVRKAQLWFATDSSHYAFGRCPTYAFEIDTGFFYGFPALEPGVLKIAEHTGGRTVADPLRLDRELHDLDMAPVRAFIGRHMPGVRPQVVRHSVCMYTMTPDQHFVIDRHPQHAHVVFACGFSGHGFKFAPVVGEALADLAMTGRTELPIGFLGVNRPALKAGDT